MSTLPPPDDGPAPPAGEVDPRITRIGQTILLVYACVGAAVTLAVGVLYFAPFVWESLGFDDFLSDRHHPWNAVTGVSGALVFSLGTLLAAWMVGGPSSFPRLASALGIAAACTAFFHFCPDLLWTKWWDRDLPGQVAMTALWLMAGLVQGMLILGVASRFGWRLHSSITPSLVPQFRLLELFLIMSVAALLCAVLVNLWRDEWSAWYWRHSATREFTRFGLHLWCAFVPLAIVNTTALLLAAWAPSRSTGLPIVIPISTAILLGSAIIFHYDPWQPFYFLVPAALAQYAFVLFGTMALQRIAEWWQPPDDHPVVCDE